jgi:hypothetical protein
VRFSAYVLQRVAARFLRSAAVHMLVSRGNVKVGGCWPMITDAVR